MISKSQANTEPVTLYFKTLQCCNHFIVSHFIPNFRFFSCWPFNNPTETSGALFSTAWYHPSAWSYCSEPLCLQRARLARFFKGLIHLKTPQDCSIAEHYRYTTNVDNMWSQMYEFTNLCQDGSGLVWGRLSQQPFKMKILKWMPGGVERGRCCC